MNKLNGHLSILLTYLPLCNFLCSGCLPTKTLPSWNLYRSRVCRFNYTRADFHFTNLSTETSRSPHSVMDRVVVQAGTTAAKRRSSRRNARTAEQRVRRVPSDHPALSALGPSGAPGGNIASFHLALAGDTFLSLTVLMLLCSSRPPIFLCAIDVILQYS